MSVSSNITHVWETSVASLVISQYRKSGVPQERPKAFTLMELLVVISIVVILAALLFPAFGSAKKSAGLAKDTANLRQIGALAQSYAAENDGKLPPLASAFWGNPPYWFELISGSLGVEIKNDPQYGPVVGTGKGPERIFFSPLLKNDNSKGVSRWNIGYGWNFCGLTFIDLAYEEYYGQSARIGQIPQPSKTIMVTGRTENSLQYVCAPVNWPEFPQAGNYKAALPIDERKGNALFVDGHVEVLAGYDAEGNLVEGGLYDWKMYSLEKK